VSGAGGTLTLAATGSLNVSSINPGTVPLVSVSTLDLSGNNAFPVYVEPALANGVNLAPLQAGLSLTSSVLNGGLLKTGNGLLSLGGSSTFSGGVELQGGGLLFAASSTAAPVTAGPLGTGALTLSSNNLLLSADATARTLANTVVFGGSAAGITLGNANSGSLILSGPLVWGGSSGTARTLTVNSTNGVILAGTIAGAAAGDSLVKEGPGLLVLSGSGNSATWGTGGPQAFVLNNGSLEVQGTGSVFEPLGISPLTLTANNIVLNGGVLSLNASGTLDSRRGIAIGPDSGSGAGVLSVAAGRTVTYAGTIGNNGAGTGSLMKAGPGTLTLSGAQAYSGATIVSGGQLNLLAAGSAALAGILPGNSSLQLNGGTLGLSVDGDGSVRPETLSVAENLTVNSFGTVVLNRAGGLALPQFTQAANKVLQLGSLTLNSGTFAVTPAAGFGLEFAGATTVTGGSATFSVGGVQTSDVPPALRLSGRLTAAQGFTKSGTGTLLLAGANANLVGGTLTGILQGTLNINAGVLAVNADSGLGDSLNQIVLNGGGFAAFESFSTRRQFLFNSAQANNLIQVARGKTLELAGNLESNTGFRKADNGTLLMSGDNSQFIAPIDIAAGAVRVTTSTALGSPFYLTSVLATGAALQLDGASGALDLPELLSLVGTGLNGTGALENLRGNNTASGAITLGGAATIAAGAGTRLTLTGGVSGNQALTLGGAGTLEVSTTAVGAVNTLTKTGAGSATLSVASPAFVTAFAVQGGTFTVSGDGRIGAGSSAAVSLGAILRLDDTLTPVAGRLGGGSRSLSLTDATFEYLVNPTAGSSDSFGVLTSNFGGNRIRVQTSGRPSTLTAASFSNGGGSQMVFEATGTRDVFGSPANTLLFSAAPTLTNGLLPRAVVVDSQGINFATYSTGGISALLPSNTDNSLLTPANTDTPRITLSVPVLSRTLNAFSTLGTGVTLSAAGGLQALTLTSGNLLVAGGTTTIASNVNMVGGTEVAVFVAPAATLNVDGLLSVTNNVSFGLGGTVNFRTPQYFNNANNWTAILGGTVRLAGGLNTLYPNQNLAVGAGGVLDLNGNTQWVGQLSIPNYGAGLQPGGVILNSSTLQATLLTNVAGNARNFGGQFAGNLSYVKSGSQLLILYGGNPYTGPTLINGGQLTLQDDARLSGSTQINVHYAQLNVVNTGTIDLPDRLRSDATLTLRGGFLSLSGRADTASSQTLNVLRLEEGLNNVALTLGSTGGSSIRSVLLAVGTLQVNPDATGLFWTHPTGQIGSAPRITFGSGVNLVNNVLPWVSNGADLLSYTAGSASGLSGGLAPMGSVGYAAYDSGTLGLAGQSSATQNIKLASTSAVVPDMGGGTYALNALVATWRFTNPSLTFANGNDTLNLTSGGLLSDTFGAFTGTIGTTLAPGRLTAGGTLSSGTARLYLHINGGALNVNSAIVDNGAGAATRLVLALVNSGSITLAGANSYQGGTVLDGGAAYTGTVRLSGTLPAGGLTVNNATFLQVAGGTINPANDLVLNGSSTVTLLGSNTLRSLLFNNSGGNTAPTFNAGTLTLTQSLTASSQNVSNTSVLAGTLDFGGTPRTFTINPVQADGALLSAWAPTLNITARIQNAGLLSIEGGGVLQLSGNNDFAGGVFVNGNSGLLLGASSTGTPVTSGPVGTGTLTFGAGAAILADAARTLANPLVLQGSLSFTGVQNLSLTGPVALPSGTLDLAVTGPMVTTTLSGTLSSAGVSAIRKAGYGTLVLSGTANAASWNTGGSRALVVQNGLLEIQGASGTAFEALGTSPVGTVADNIVLDGGGLSLNLTSATGTLDARRGILVGGTAGTAGGLISVASGKTVTYAGTIANDGSGTGGLVKSGAGTLVLTGANTFAGPAYVTAGVLTVTGSSAAAASAVLPGSGSVRLSGGGFSVALDGDGTGRLETLAVAETVVLEQGGALTVGRAGSFAGVFNQAANKTVQLAGLTLGNNIATVTANNGFGLEITGATTLSGTLAGFNVASTQAADTLPALRLSGPCRARLASTSREPAPPSLRAITAQRSPARSRSRRAFSGRPPTPRSGIYPMRSTSTEPMPRLPLSTPSPRRAPSSFPTRPTPTTSFWWPPVQR
jgi:autotransporter-associated beta strand protein